MSTSKPGTPAKPAAQPAKSTPSSAKSTTASSAHGVIELGEKDLPAFCPNRQMSVWNQHPRVFLDVTTTGQAACPYCGTQYRLKPGTIVKGH